MKAGWIQIVCDKRIGELSGHGVHVVKREGRVIKSVNKICRETSTA